MGDIFIHDGTALRALFLAIWVNTVIHLLAHLVGVAVLACRLVIHFSSPLA